MISKPSLIWAGPYMVFSFTSHDISISDLPIPVLFQVTPSSGTSSTIVTVLGVLWRGGNTRCKFGNNPLVPATIIGSGELVSKDDDPD
jgi:hypothetical protein